MPYLLELPGLAQRVDAAPVVPKHTGLLEALRRFEPLSAATLATQRDGFTLHRRKVLDPDGVLVADDHEAWLAGELARDLGRGSVTAERLRPLGYQLSECTMDMLYFIADRGGAQDNFVQVEVELQHERVHRRLFSEYISHRALHNLSDLVREAEDGWPLDPAAQLPIGRDRYQLYRCVDVPAFLADAEQLKTADHAVRRRATLEVTDIEEGPNAKPPVTRRMTIDELDPGAKHWVWPARRLFDDWAASSAGRAGQRLCEHWALQIADYTSPEGRRDVEVIPLWTHTRPIAKVKSVANIHTLLGKLQSIDACRGAGFAWFFYMLHGTLVEPWAGKRVLKAAEDGLIVLPEHDYQILRRWNERGYGF